MEKVSLDTPQELKFVGHFGHGHDGKDFSDWTPLRLDGDVTLSEKDTMSIENAVLELQGQNAL